MGDVKFTVIELYVDGEQVGPRSIGSLLPFGTVTGEEQAELSEAAAEGEKGVLESESESEFDAEAEMDTDDDDSGSSLIGALIALALLVAAGVAVKKYRGGDEEPPEYESETEPDVVVD
ncbi:hypothetical protein C500_17846 [Natrialba magadii ATCC 43099]|uniref:Uncharacterized protein n=1 Tax=Natrialba magadii (strain ATCC 43099 / DSM 3394 / CCM 3739 / CIP 104546 / IAM 13178 / JCM 8861 / NBRC 102185 / NCIMB 2190 / MS3) TaxID=547559 RepID=L9UK51_NATMM|nr:hypothetical protein [Natrialba magadii]ELY25305.1 hypothetical protein C500_17846 [Natrialba magadii ATCC 43099]